MYRALTYDVMKYYLTHVETRKFVMAILHGKQGLLSDKFKYRKRFDYMYLIHTLEKRGLLNVQTVSTLVSLHSPRRLVWVKLFCHSVYFLFDKEPESVFIVI